MEVSPKCREAQGRRACSLCLSWKVSLRPSVQQSGVKDRADFLGCRGAVCEGKVRTEHTVAATAQSSAWQ